MSLLLQIIICVIIIFRPRLKCHLLQKSFPIPRLNHLPPLGGSSPELLPSPCWFLPCLSQQPVAPRGLAGVLLMTASWGNMAELEHLGVRANTLEGDVHIPSSRGLQSCAMALVLPRSHGNSECPSWRWLSMQTSLVCIFPRSHMHSLEPIPSSLASGRCSDQGPLELTLPPLLLSSFLCLPASPSLQQLLLRSQISLTWIWPFGQMEEAIYPLPRLSLPECPYISLG